MITYFTVYRKDAIYNRIGVLVALLADVICAFVEHLPGQP